MDTLSDEQEADSVSEFIEAMDQWTWEDQRS